MKRTVAAITFTLFIVFESFAQNAFIKHYTTKDGIPSSDLYDIHFSDDGFLWIATNDGILRFDGRNILHFNTENGLDDNQTKRIVEDSSGRLGF